MLASLCLYDRAARSTIMLTESVSSALKYP